MYKFIREGLHVMIKDKTFNIVRLLKFYLSVCKIMQCLAGASDFTISYITLSLCSFGYGGTEIQTGILNLTKIANDFHI